MAVLDRGPSGSVTPATPTIHQMFELLTPQAKVFSRQAASLRIAHGHAARVFITAVSYPDDNWTSRVLHAGGIQASSVLQVVNIFVDRNQWVFEEDNLEQKMYEEALAFGGGSIDVRELVAGAIKSGSQFIDVVIRVHKQDPDHVVNAILRR